MLSAVVLAVVTASSCRERQEEPGFRPEDELAGRASFPAEAVPFWRSRVQHTRGRVGEDLFPCLSPDRRTLYFSTTRFSRGFDLVSKSLDGYTLSFLTNSKANDVHAAVSPDGQVLAFASDRTGVWSIFLLETKPNGRLQQLALGDVDALGPRWSPDGTKLAYFRRGRGAEPWEIWTVDLQTNVQTYVTDGLFPDWSPRGDWIVLQRARKRGERWYSIWLVSVDGSRLIDLLASWNDRWGAVHPVWSPDARWVAFTALGKNYKGVDVVEPRPGPLESDIYLVSVEGSQLIDLTGDRPNVSEWNPHFGGDWNIYFTSNQDGATRIWSVDTRIEKERPPATKRQARERPEKRLLDASPTPITNLTTSGGPES